MTKPGPTGREEDEAMKRTPSMRQMIDEGYIGAADILPDEIMEMIDRGEIDLDDVLPRDDDDDDLDGTE